MNIVAVNAFAIFEVFLFFVWETAVHETTKKAAMNFRQNTRDMPSIPYEERIAQIKRDLMMATQQALVSFLSP